MAGYTQHWQVSLLMRTTWGHIGAFASIDNYIKKIQETIYKF
jgi:hypothetical protein